MYTPTANAHTVSDTHCDSLTPSLIPAAMSTAPNASVRTLQWNHFHLISEAEVRTGVTWIESVPPT